MTAARPPNAQGVSAESTENRVRVQVNGEERAVHAGSTVADLLEGLGLRRDGVAVAINRQVVPRSRHPTHPLQPDDRIEVIQAVGGG